MTNPMEIMSKGLCEFRGGSLTCSACVVVDDISQCTGHYFQDEVLAIADALKQAGYQIVPVVPTEAMNRAANKTPATGGHIAEWAAMLKAAKEQGE